MPWQQTSAGALSDARRSLVLVLHSTIHALARLCDDTARMHRFPTLQYMCDSKGLALQATQTSEVAMMHTGSLGTTLLSQDLTSAAYPISKAISAREQSVEHTSLPPTLNCLLTVGHCLRLLKQCSQTLHASSATDGHQVRPVATSEAYLVRQLMISLTYAVVVLRPDDPKRAQLIEHVRSLLKFLDLVSCRDFVASSLDFVTSLASMTGNYHIVTLFSRTPYTRAFLLQSLVRKTLDTLKHLDEEGAPARLHMLVQQMTLMSRFSPPTKDVMMPEFLSQVLPICLRRLNNREGMFSVVSMLRLLALMAERWQDHAMLSEFRSRTVQLLDALGSLYSQLEEKQKQRSQQSETVRACLYVLSVC